MPAPVLRRLRQAACHPLTWLVVAALVPIVVAFVRAVAHGWAPEGDDAVIADRMRAVFSARPPLMGQRSTSVLTGGADVPTHHLGPLEYYLAAPIAAVFGFSGPGVLLSVAVGNALAAAGSVVVAFRLRGLRTGVPVALAVVLTEWSFGPEQLVRPLNTYVATLPMLLVLVCAWALVDGDLAVLWCYAAAASLVAQADLAFVPFVLGLTLALAGLALWRRARGVRMSPMTPSRARRRWLVTGAVLLLGWLPALLELVIFEPNNLQEVLRYYRASSGAGTPWPRALAYALDRLSPVGFGRFHNAYSPPQTGPAVGAGAVVVTLLALGALAGRHRPRTAGSFACGLAALCVPVEAWGLTHMTGFPVGYWLLPTSVIAAFAAAALLARSVELVARGGAAAVRARFPARLRLLVSGVLALTLVALACGTAAAPSWADEDSARQATDVVTTYLATHARSAAPVVVRGTQVASLSADSAIGLQLGRRGFRAYYMTSWPVPEDTDPWHISDAPPTHVTVLIAERSGAARWSPARPAGYAALPLGRFGNAPLCAWVDIPPALAR